MLSFLFSAVKNIRKVACKLSDKQNTEFGLNDQRTLSLGLNIFSSSMYFTSLFIKFQTKYLCYAIHKHPIIVNYTFSDMLRLCLGHQKRYNSKYYI